MSINNELLNDNFIKISINQMQEVKDYDKSYSNQKIIDMIET